MQPREWSRGKISVGVVMGIACLTLVVGFGLKSTPSESAGDSSIASRVVHSLAADVHTVAHPAKPGIADRRKVEQTIAQMPITFEQNLGQTHEDVRFLAHGRGYTFYLTAEEAVLVFRREIKEEKESRRRHEPRSYSQSILRMRFEGANAETRLSALDEQPGKSNYLIGNDPAQWTRNVPHFKKVKYEDLYPGIDLVHYGNPGALEHDFIVAPGADPYAISMSFAGLVSEDGKALEINDDGSLTLLTHGGPVRMQAPVTYQKRHGKRTTVPSRYVVKDGNRIAFQVAAYDSSRELIIDPILAYQSYVGGSMTDQCSDIKVDSSENAYITGYTASTNFPVSGSPFQSTLSSTSAAFVTKLDSSASALVYSTYLGGTDGATSANAIALDASDQAHITGSTTSTTFPATGGFQTTNGGMTDAFLAKFSADGSSLLFGSYHGGSEVDVGIGIAVDSSGGVYGTGLTQSSADLPVEIPGFQETFGGAAEDGFVVKTPSTGASRIYSSYLGGSGIDAGLDIAVNGSGNAYVTGYTGSSDFFISGGAPQSTLGGGLDAFVTMVSADGQSLTYSTFLGGGQSENVTYAGIALGSGDVAYVCGTTASPDFPAANGAQATLGGQDDVFIARLNAAGTAFDFASYFGGTAVDQGDDIALDGSEGIYVSGVTSSTDFPLQDEINGTLNGSGDAFLAHFDPFASTLTLNYSTYLGGSGNETEASVAVSSNANAFVGGTTESSDLLATAGVLQTSSGGGTDAFVAQVTVSGGGGTPTPGASLFAELTADVTEGSPPLVVNFDGGQSDDPAGGTPTKRAIVAYIWDFGDGTTNATASATVSHTYATTGTFAASLQVRNEVGELSTRAYLPIVVGDGVADDTDLFLSKGAVSLKPAAEDSDSVSFSGIMNPAGLPASVAGARLRMTINGNDVTGDVELRSSRSSRSQARAGGGSIALLSPSTGKFKVTAKGINLKNTAGVDTKFTAAKPVRMEIEVEVTNTTITTPKAKAVVNMDFKTKAEKSGKGKFSFLKLPTFTGFFKSQRTKVKEGKTGGHVVSASGPVQAELSGPVTPTGDITVTIGGDGTPSSGVTFTIPLAALGLKGSGEKTSWTYSKKLQEITELKKFQINNGKRKFILTTNELAGTSIPAAGAGGTTFDLRVVIVVPTANGPLTLTTTIEIKRSAASSGSWKR